MSLMNIAWGSFLLGGVVGVLCAVCLGWGMNLLIKTYVRDMEGGIDAGQKTLNYSWAAILICSQMIVAGVVALKSDVARQNPISFGFGMVVFLMITILVGAKKWSQIR